MTCDAEKITIFRLRKCVLSCIIGNARREGQAIFNIGFSELLVVLLIAFLVVGPKDLPKVARWLGRAVRQIRSLVKEVKEETGWDEIEKEMRDTKSELNQLKKDADITADLKNASADLNRELKDVQKGLGEAEKAYKSAARKDK